MAKIPAAVSKSITQYLSLVKRHHPLQMAFLFGSHAAGKAYEWSDIDLALVSQDFARDPTDSLIRLMRLAVQVDWRIEPHVFSPGDFNSNHPLAAEIRERGIRVMPKKRRRVSQSRHKSHRQKA